MPPIDVVVVGGGIVGTAAAAELAASGASVVLVERTAIAAGASGRNSGAVWRPSDPILEQLYLEALPILRSLADEDSGGDQGDPAFRMPATPAGILLLGEDDAAIWREAEGLGGGHPQFGARYVGSAELRGMEPHVAPGLAAVRLDIAFPVAPAAATRAFARRARRDGARIDEGSGARLLKDGDRVAGVVTDDGRRIVAGATVVAAGPWTPSIIEPSGAWRPIRPFWGVVVELALDPPPRHVLEGPGIDAATTPGTPAPDAEDRLDPRDRGVHFSLVTAGGRSSLGSTFLPDEPDPHVYEPRLRALGARYVPAIAASATRSLRVCARPLALDGHPLVGPVPGVEGLYVAAGHGPWGLSTGAATGRHVAGLVLGRPDAIPDALRAALDPARFGVPVVAGA